MEFETVDAYLRLNAVRTPSRPALVCGGRHWTWSQLDADVECLAGRLVTRGLQRGKTCGLLAPNGAPFVIGYHAILRAGAILVPLNTRLARPELEVLLEDAEVSMLVHDSAYAEAAAPFAARVPLVALGESDLTEVPRRAAEIPALRPEDDAVIVYTSGTTGRPKGALFDHERVVWTARQQVVTCGLRGDLERHLLVVPMYHATGLALLATMTHLGATTVVLPRFDPDLVLATIESERITTMLGVPTMFQLICRAAVAGDYDVSSWRTAIFGAAPMAPVAVRELYATFPDVGFFQQCGQTEAGPAGIYQTPDQVRARPDASGNQARPFCRARVVDEAGVDVGPGEVGELLFRGRSVMKRYWNAPQATAEALRDGWLHTGDLVRLDDDGSMTVVDRKKDLIITGGRNVYSVEVETAVRACAGVRDCAVVGRPDELWGESIVAVVVPAQEGAVSLEALRRHCREQIADYKVPHDLLLVPEIPRNASGKVLKKDLRAAVAAL